MKNTLKNYTLTIKDNETGSEIQASVNVDFNTYIRIIQKLVGNKRSQNIGKGKSDFYLIDGRECGWDSSFQEDMSSILDYYGFEYNIYTKNGEKVNI